MTIEALKSASSSLPAGSHTITINMGPSHPATHGVLRLMVKLDGEVVREAVPHLGYLHTGMEKLGEHLCFHQFIPITDRMDYLAGMLMNFGYVLGVEKLLGITDQIPRRAKYIRVLFAELTRIASHLFWLGTAALDLGAMSPVFYCLDHREKIMDIFEETAGCRLTSTYFRIGGVRSDIPDSAIPLIKSFIEEFPRHLEEYHTLLTNNEIFKNRTKGIGVLTPETAFSHSCTGPVLRGSGVNYDVRKANPYSGYDEFSFRVPVYHDGDCYSRYLVRMDELAESLSIVKQAFEGLPSGPYQVEDSTIILPKKYDVQRKMEELINHFILSARGLKPPAGEVFSTIESSKGEFGVFLVSDGSEKPYRIRVHSPSFLNLSTLPTISKGCLFADLVAIIGSLDIVLGEIDR